MFLFKLNLFLKLRDNLFVFSFIRFFAFILALIFSVYFLDKILFLEVELVFLLLSFPKDLDLDLEDNPFFLKFL